MSKWAYYFRKCHERRTCPVVIPKPHCIRQPNRLPSPSYLSRSDQTYGCRDISPGLNPRPAFLAVSGHFTVGISRVKAIGKMAFSQHVPRTRYASQRPDFATLHSTDMSATSCENFSPLLAVVQATGRPHRPYCTEADRQTDGKTYRRTPINLMN